jgi:hypothetical protein
MDPGYFKAQAEIQHELDSGEKLLWSGQPRQGLCLNASDAFVIPFSLVWCGFAIFWETSVIKDHAPLLFKLWGVPFVAIGLYMLFGRFFAGSYMRARTYYGATDKRLIIVTNGFSRHVRSPGWQSLPEATLTERGDGGGVINFGPRLPLNLSQSGNVDGWPGSSRSLMPVLDLPERAREAYNAIQRAQQAVEREEPSGFTGQTSPHFASSAKLLPPPPRRVHGRLGGNLWFIRIFIMPHVLIGIGVVGYLIFLLIWRMFGTDFPATVTDAKVSHSSKHGDSYVLYYRFEAGGQTRLDSDTVGWSIYQTYQNQARDQSGPPVTVRYLSLGPLHHSKLLESGSLWAEVGFLVLWAAFWNGVLSIFVYAIWIKPIRARLLYKYGSSTSGKLLHKRVRTGKSTAYYVGYRFNDPASGHEYESEIQVWKADDWRQAVEGQPVTVLYAQNNPKRSTVYEFGGYRVEGV